MCPLLDAFSTVDLTSPVTDMCTIWSSSTCLLYGRCSLPVVEIVSIAQMSSKVGINRPMKSSVIKIGEFTNAFLTSSATIEGYSLRQECGDRGPIGLQAA